jgi:ATP-dependent protease ClpP protease subunit
MPEAKTFARPQNFQWDAPSDVLAKWAERPLAAEADDANTISIYDVIGEDFWTGGGFTAKRMSAALRSIGKNDVTIKINSPGGDMFEGIAIYNLLREHPAKVTVDVMGWAASAASIIAMAGDDIRMGLGTFMMVHNAWGVVIGNRHDMREASDLFEGFDAAIADIYEARTGMERKAITKLMDAESFMGATQAVENGFADTVDNGLKAKAAEGSPFSARGRMDTILARAGVPRSERRKMFREVAGTQDAAGSATPSAGFDWSQVAAFTQTIKQ